MSWLDSSSSLPRRSRRCWLQQVQLQRSKWRTSSSSSHPSRKRSPIPRSPSSPSTRRKHGTSRSRRARSRPGRRSPTGRSSSGRAGPQADIFWGGESALFDKLAEQKLLARSICRRRPSTRSRRASASRSRSAQGSEGLLDRHRARALRPRLSPAAAAAPRRAAAEGLGRPARSEAEGQRRAVRADALVAAATRPTR